MTLSHETAHEVSFLSPDGLHLSGTVVRPAGRPTVVAIFVHGGGVTREEGGFFTRLAGGLAGAGLASLRFDFRAHGQSEGRREEMTLAGILGDVRAAVAQARAAAGASTVVLIGASFGGGICAYYAARHASEVQALVLLNPLLDYKGRFVDQKPYWHDGQIDEDAGAKLTRDGFLAHSPTVRLGRPLLNEVFYLRPDEALDEVRAPTLIVHGTGDTFIPVESSREAVARFGGTVQLVEIEGAEHGFAVHQDPEYADPQTQEWQALVIRTIADWVRVTAALRR